MVVSTIYGAYSATVFAPSGDVPSVVLNNLTTAYAQTGLPIPMASSQTGGLNVAYSYLPRVNGTVNLLRYTVAPGYWFTWNGGVQTIQVGGWWRWGGLVLRVVLRVLRVRAGVVRE